MSPSHSSVTCSCSMDSISSPYSHTTAQTYCKWTCATFLSKIFGTTFNQVTMTLCMPPETFCSRYHACASLASLPIQKYTRYIRERRMRFGQDDANHHRRPWLTVAKIHIFGCLRCNLISRIRQHIREGYRPASIPELCRIAYPHFLKQGEVHCLVAAPKWSHISAFEEPAN